MGLLFEVPDELTILHIIILHIFILKSKVIINVLKWIALAPKRGKMHAINNKILIKNLLLELCIFNSTVQQ